MAKARCSGAKLAALHPCWKQSSEQRFTVIFHQDKALEDELAPIVLGKAIWKVANWSIIDYQGWEEHLSARMARQSFHRLIIYSEIPETRMRYLVMNGIHELDSNGDFIGYHGTMRDIIKEQLNEPHAETIELAAIGIGHVTPDGKFIHVNQKLCRLQGQ